MPYIDKVVIGDCTLFHGDCKELDFSDIGWVGSIVTDPPYGMSFKSGRREVKHKDIQNDDTLEHLLWSVDREWFVHSKYIFCRWDNLKDVKQPKSCITWVKNNHGMGDLEHEHARQTEIILFYQGGSHFFPDKRPSDVIKSVKTGNNYHPTEKPVDLMQKIIQWTDGIVFDPFMGSGSTGVAAVKMGRKFVGCEINKEYFDIAVQRIKDAYSQPDLFL